jgi:hypothetical protein
MNRSECTTLQDGECAATGLTEPGLTLTFGDIAGELEMLRVEAENEPSRTPF